MSSSVPTGLELESAVHPKTSCPEGKVTHLSLPRYLSGEERRGCGGRKDVISGWLVEGSGLYIGRTTWQLLPSQEHYGDGHDLMMGNGGTKFLAMLLFWVLCCVASS